MKRLLLAAIVAMAASGPAWAQSSTATGTGVGVARSTSSSQAISGQGGAATITSNSTVPAEQTVKSVPGVIAPGLSAAGLERARQLSWDRCAGETLAVYREAAAHSGAAARQARRESA